VRARSDLGTSEWSPWSLASFCISPPQAAKALGRFTQGIGVAELRFGGIPNPGRNQDGLGMVCGCFVLFNVATFWRKGPIWSLKVESIHFGGSKLALPRGCHPEMVTLNLDGFIPVNFF